MIKLIKKYWEEKPLLVVLIAGGLLRLISVIFSKGWGMHDDHFLVIEASQSWVDDKDYNQWLPVDGNTTPPGHSFLYPGLHYLLFIFLRWLHITCPQTKMYIVRFIHAAYSMLVIYFGYKITERLSNKRTAATAGLLLAVYWFMPFYSVRNLVEIVCIPLLMWSVWIIIKQEPNKNLTGFLNLLGLFMAGCLLGIAFCVRYQTIIFTGGILLTLLIQKKWKEPVSIGFGTLLMIILFEGGIDYYVWHQPFIELKEYIRYNLANAYNYITLPWYHYIGFLLGVLLPPVSIFLFFGFFRVWRKHVILFLPSFLFLVFHSYFPNKQERFILTIIPFIIIAGIIGWNDFIIKSSFRIKRTKLLKGCWTFFWIINLIILPVITTWYSKRARVESMVYLSKYKDIKCLLQEGDTKLLPRYYLGQWVNVYDINDNKTFEIVKKELASKDKNNLPKFVLFYENKNLNERVNKIETIIPNIKYETTIEPGMMDKILYWMNPNNVNQTIYIYKRVN